MLSRGPPWKLVLVVVTTVLGVAASSSSDLKNKGLSENEVGDCRVSSHLQVDQPSEVPLLAYVSGLANLTLGFISASVTKEWDSVSLNSTGATHSKVRGGRNNWTDVALPRLIPEGWNTFTLTVARKSVTVTLVQGEDRLTLLTLRLPRLVTTVYAEGTVAHCRRASPEWEMLPGEEVKVVLQPWGSGKDQWVEVSGGRWGAAALYVAFPSVPRFKTPVPANTVLRIATSLRGNYTLLRLFKDREGKDEQLVEVTVPVTPLLTMLVGDGRGGGASGDNASFHLRLMLSPPSSLVTAVMNENKDKENTWSDDLSDGTALLVVEAVLVLVVVVGLMVFLMRRKPWVSREKSLLGSRDESLAEMITSLSALKREFGERLTYKGDGDKTLVLKLYADEETPKLLKKLHKRIYEVDLLEACVPEASKFRNMNQLSGLPDAQKVNLDVAGLTNGDLTNGDLERVCSLVKKLKPRLGYSRIDFRAGSSDGAMRDEDWKELLLCLHKSKVKVKNKVCLPPNVIGEELKSLGFHYECRKTDD